MVSHQEFGPKKTTGATGKVRFLKEKARKTRK